jgi:hypothetical protein
VHLVVDVEHDMRIGAAELRRRRGQRAALAAADRSRDRGRTPRRARLERRGVRAEIKTRSGRAPVRDGARRPRAIAPSRRLTRLCGSCRSPLMIAVAGRPLRTRAADLVRRGARRSGTLGAAGLFVERECSRRGRLRMQALQPMHVLVEVDDAVLALVQR